MHSLSREVMTYQQCFLGLGVYHIYPLVNVDIPAGYDYHSHGESTINGGLELGKSSINGPFSMAMLNDQ